MTLSFASPELAAEWSRDHRQAGRSVGFVPTMGALHVGHLGLVRRSVSDNDLTCVSIFVNPLQFDRADDLEHYPRDLEKDATLLESVGCDVLFTGELTQFFPEMGGDPGRDDLIETVDPGPRSAGLEGEHRTGHFEGVATIVKRLFELIHPDCAYFGEKDFQQCLVVEDVARDLGYPRVQVIQTIREASGLAYSSRNERLSELQRIEASAISRGLFSARELWQSGERNVARLMACIESKWNQTSLETEYVELRDPKHWEEGALTGEVEQARALIAARLGPVRLIDNLRLDDPTELAR